MLHHNEEESPQPKFVSKQESKLPVLAERNLPAEHLSEVQKRGNFQTGIYSQKMKLFNLGT
jgi:hypothetical protein